jgi:hypothetical protein
MDQFRTGHKNLNELPSAEFGMDRLGSFQTRIEHTRRENHSSIGSVSLECSSLSPGRAIRIHKKDTNSSPNVLDRHPISWYEMLFPVS